MGTQIGMQSSYWWGTSLGKYLYRTIEYTAKIGADYVEISPALFLDMPGAERHALRRHIEGLGMTVTVNGSMMHAQSNLCSADEEVVQAGLALCARIMEGCADLGAPIWTGVMHGIWGARPASSDIAREITETRAHGLEGVSRAMAIAVQYDVMLCLEIVNRFEMFYLNTAADGIDFCRQVDDPHCTLLLDTYHMSIEEDNLVDALRLTQESGLLGCLHAGETNRRIPVGGKSNIDWTGAGHALRSSGYTGPITLEPFVFLSPNYSPNVCVWRNLQDPEDLAAAVETGKAGVDFLRGILR